MQERETKQAATDRPRVVYGLKVQNMMKVRMAEIHPDGAPVVVIGGENGQGKTSIIRSVFAAQEIENMAADFDAVYAFLREHYLHSRFEGRNAEWPKGVPEGGTYSELVARGALEHLEKYGDGMIGPYESRTGRAIHYDADLNILNPDEPPAQIQRKAGHLTHIYGA